MIRDTSTQDEIIEQPSAFSRRRLVIGITAAAVLGAGVVIGPSLGRWSSAEQSVARERLRFSTVERGDLERDVTAQGSVVAAVKPTLFSPAAGVVALTVQAGEAVTEGEVLARIASPELGNLLEQESSALASAETALKRQQIEARTTALENQQRVDIAGVELTAARRELERAEAAFAKQAISEFDLAKARDDLATAELRHRHAVEDAGLQDERLAFEAEAARLDIDRQRLRVADLERQVGELEIRSPVTGIVGNLLVADRDAVAADAPLLTVVDLSAFEVELQVPDAYGSILAPGLAATVTHQGRAWDATVVSVSPEVVNSQVTTRVRFDGEVPANMRQNQRVAARILLEGKDDVLMIDRGPFLESGGGRITYVVDGDLARRRSIETGLVSVGRVEILGGLRPGEQVIVSSLDVFDDAEVVYLSN